MLVRDTAKTTITLFNFVHLDSQADRDPQLFYKKTIIPDCIWQQDSEASFRKTGKALLDAVKLLIPYNPEYFSSQRGEFFKGTGWTVEIGPELLGTYIVQGESAFNFPQDVFEGYFRKYIQPFEKTHKYKRPKELVEHFTGSRNLWYLEVRC